MIEERERPELLLRFENRTVGAEVIEALRHIEMEGSSHNEA